MRLQNFEVKITANTVDVKRDDSNRSIKSRVAEMTFLFAFPVLLFAWFMFKSDRYGHSAWWYLVNYPRNSSDFLSALFASVLISALSVFLLALGVRSFFPSGESLQGDKSTFTVSEIPWLSFSGKWKVRSFPLGVISQLRFDVVQSGKGNSLYGILFLADGKKQKILAGLQAPEASRILRGLKSLGADVQSDPDMLTKIQEAIRERRSQL